MYKLVFNLCLIPLICWFHSYVLISSVLICSFFLNLIYDILWKLGLMTIRLHHLSIDRPIPLFDPLGLPQAPAIYIVIKEIKFAWVFTEIGVVITQQVSGFEIHPALLPLLLLSLVQLHLWDHVAVRWQKVAQGVVILKRVKVVVFGCAH